MTTQWYLVKSSKGVNESIWVSPAEFGECNRNSIYFSDDYYGGHDMGFFSLDDNVVTECFQAHAQRIVPPPLWGLSHSLKASVHTRAEFENLLHVVKPNPKEMSHDRNEFAQGFRQRVSSPQNLDKIGRIIGPMKAEPRNPGPIQDQTVAHEEGGEFARVDTLLLVLGEINSLCFQESDGIGEVGIGIGFEIGEIELSNV
ncbi:Domain unknown function DUF295 [Dillenia turbinata]|uniref:DUF295 domain-containing protein n=1 Tax=Dillenia turbinata TaxID=194707 RepID=A0AAN8V8W9_9MAGN